MNKLKMWIKDHYKLIIICLLILMMLKSCKSCSAERRFEYTINKYNYIIDSVNNITDSLEYTIDTKNIFIKQLIDSINTLKYENNILKVVIDDTKKDKEYYRKQNSNLATMAENLTKKDTIK